MADDPKGGTATATPPAAGGTTETPKVDPPKGDPPKEDPPKSDATFGEKDAKGTPAVVPDKYELVAPKDSGFDEKVLERTATTARALGLNNENAQRVLELVHGETALARKAVLDSFEPGKGAEWLKQEKAWRDAAFIDPDLGNGIKDRFDGNVQLAKRVIATFFDEETADFLERTGLGSNPATLKGLVRIGRKFSEGQLVLPKAEGSGERKPTADVLYGEPKAAT